MAKIKANPNRIAVIGGTFDALHQGHKDYINLAFEFSSEVIIFLTSDAYAQTYKSKEVQSYDKRKKRLNEYIQQLNLNKNYSIFSLSSQHQLINFYLDNEIYIAVLSPAYYSLFEEINKQRFKNGKNEILLLIKPRSRAPDGTDINSTQSSS